MMVALRPILKSLPLYTPDMMKHARITRFASIDSDPDADDHEDEDGYEREQVKGSGSVTLASPALPFASTAHIPPFSPHVHFPPTPILTQMAMTHSSVSYDRKPIQVQPNELALPARGEREIGSESESDAEVEADVGTDAEGEARARTGPGSVSGVQWNSLANGGGDYDQGYFQLPTRSYDVEVMDSMDMDVEQDVEQELEERWCSFETSRPRNSSSRRRSPKLASAPKPQLKSRPQTPHHHSSAFPSSVASRFEQFLPPPPPLVFDPSSESDSDLCISPSSGQSPDQVSHMSQISLHLAGLASKLPLEHDHDDHGGVVPARTPAPQLSLSTQKRAEDQRLPSSHSMYGNRSGVGDGLAKRRLKSCGSKRARIADDADAGYRTSTSRSTSSESRFSTTSSFFEGSLDGCLGGF